ncbi:histone-lysine N-methyltransferase 2B-like isoform X2 [Ornithodoros turicata]|uniref:histone-lysine N-methyltransferase 2B-like isoform X2 n=1 Tax=Ornithodoros turicata TaxID=34597 RepID=UPI00313A3B51
MIACFAKKDKKADKKGKKDDKKGKKSKGKGDKGAKPQKGGKMGKPGGKPSRPPPKAPPGLQPDAEPEPEPEPEPELPPLLEDVEPIPSKSSPKDDKEAEPTEKAPEAAPKPKEASPQPTTDKAPSAAKPTGKKVSSSSSFSSSSSSSLPELVSTITVRSSSSLPVKRKGDKFYKIDIESTTCRCPYYEFDSSRQQSTIPEEQYVLRSTASTAEGKYSLEVVSKERLPQPSYRYNVGQPQLQGVPSCPYEFQHQQALSLGGPLVGEAQYTQQYFQPSCPQLLQQQSLYPRATYSPPPYTQTIERGGRRGTQQSIVLSTEQVQEPYKRPQVLQAQQLQPPLMQPQVVQSQHMHLPIQQSPVLQSQCAQTQMIQPQPHQVQTAQRQSMQQLHSLCLTQAKSQLLQPQQGQYTNNQSMASACPLLQQQVNAATPVQVPQGGQAVLNICCRSRTQLNQSPTTVPIQYQTAGCVPSPPPPQYQTTFQTAAEQGIPTICPPGCPIPGAMTYQGQTGTVSSVLSRTAYRAQSPIVVEEPPPYRRSPVVSAQIIERRASGKSRASAQPSTSGVLLGIEMKKGKTGRTKSEVETRWITKLQTSSDSDFSIAHASSKRKSKDRNCKNGQRRTSVCKCGHDNKSCKSKR